MSNSAMQFGVRSLRRWLAASGRQDESDEQLLHAFTTRRDDSAFAVLVHRHGPMVLHVCRRLLSHEQDAEDAFQATFLVLAQSAAALRNKSSLAGYLHRIAQRTALKAKYSAAQRRKHEAHAPGRLSADPADEISWREVRALLDEEIARLAEKYRTAFVLCCLEELRQAEAARRLGVNERTLSSRLVVARKRLSQRLARRGVELTAVMAASALATPQATALTVGLIGATLKAVMSAAAGEKLSGIVPASVAELVHGATAALTVSKVNIAIPLLLTVILLVGGGAWTYCTLAMSQPAEPQTEPYAPKSPALPDDVKNAGADKPQARMDALGDPLPTGAITRLGTVRLRHTGPVTVLTFTPDGKRLISEGSDEVRVWDAATGKELWHVALGARYPYWGRAALSSDGKRLAVLPSKSPGPIQFWDMDSGKKIDSVGEKFRPPVCLSPDGKWLAAGAGVNGIALWDLAGKKELRSWEDHKQRNATSEELWSLTFSADSRKLLSKETEGMVRLWDAASGRRLQEIKPLSWDDAAVGPGTLSLPALSSDGALLAMLEVKLSPSPTPIAEPKARISIWDMATGKLARELAVPSREIRPGFAANFETMTLAPDGKKLVTTGPDGFLRVWDPATGKELRRLALDRRFSLLAFSRDGKSLAGIARDDRNSPGGAGGATIHILDAATGKDKFSPVGHLWPVQLALLTPDGRTAVTGGMEKSLLVWDMASGLVRLRLEGSDSPFLALQLSSDGRILFSCSWDKTLRVWDLASGEERRRLKLDRANFVDDRGDVGHGASFAPLVSTDGKLVVVVDSQRTIRVLDAASGEQNRQFDLEELTGIALGPDGHTLAGWSGSKRILRIWDVATGRTRHDVPLPQNEQAERVVPEYRVALSPDSRLLAIAVEHCLVLHDLDSGRDVYRFDRLPWGIDTLIFAPDGRMLACGSFNEPVIRLLETATGRERQRLTGHRGSVEVLHFSADGERLISGSSDTTALVWDLSRRFDSHKQAIALTEAKLESLWAELAGDDAARAYHAVRALAVSPTSAVPFLRKNLSPVSKVDEKRLARLIADLDSDEFAARQQTHEQLEKLGDKLGEQVLPAYRKALDSKPSLESRRRLQVLLQKAQRVWWEDISGERLRSLRGIEVLELAGTKEAREVLKSLAAGAEGARLTAEAKAALQHLPKEARQ